MSPTSGSIRRTTCIVGIAACSLLTTACISNGHLSLLGYTTAPNYDPCIRTVHVPIFKNRTFWRGLEFQLTEAVIREIHAKTPFRVVSCEEEADTVLTGTIVNFQKGLLSRNQYNEVREAETTLAVELVWLDRRNGEVLTQPRLDPGLAPLPPPGAPVLPPPPPPPVLVTATGHFIPELGGSITSAQKETVDRLAGQIVNQMEKPW